MTKHLKRVCVMLLSMSTVFCNSVGAANTKETQKISVVLNSEKIKFSAQEPAIIERRTLIPLRGIFEKMGYSLDWDANTKECTISNEGQKIIIRSGNKSMKVNNETFVLDVPAQIVNKSLMIPLRAVAECTGAVVTWDANSKTVYINTSQRDSFTYTVDNYVTDYTNAISGLSKANSLFKILNGLTDKNFAKNVNNIKRETAEALTSLNNTEEALKVMIPPSEYENFHIISLEAVENCKELCQLVDSMITGSLTYDEAAVSIAQLQEKAKDINTRLDKAVSGLNATFYK